ncbi:Outer membrane protein assembly factor BamB [bacterium HR09]|nr:Outer membrane protein assembly factor BamB [bacterium HR09]
MKRWMLVFAFVSFLPLAAEAEVVALQLERRGVEKPEQMVYGVEVETGKVVWEQRFGEEVNFVEKVKGGVLVGCDDGTLSLVEPASGQVRWTTKLGEKDEKVNTFRGEYPAGYLVSFDNETLWFVSPKGELLWFLR